MKQRGKDQVNNFDYAYNSNSFKLKFQQVVNYSWEKNPTLFASVTGIEEEREMREKIERKK